jgi:hypothetical protein
MWQQYGTALLQWVQESGPVLAIGLGAGALTLVVGRLLARPKPTPAVPPLTVSLSTGTEPRPGDRRASPRRKGAPAEVDLFDPDGLVAPQTAIIIDRSAGGLGLKAAEPVPVNRVLQVRTRRGRGERNTAVPVEIRGCRQAKDGSWTVNCRFAESLTWGELFLFE